MHAFGNLFKHYFSRAAAYGVHPCIPGHAFNGALSHEAHPAMKLQAGMHDFVNEFATVRLHHGNLSGRFNSARRQPCRMENKLPPGFDLGGKHRQAMTDRLIRP